MAQTAAPGRASILRQLQRLATQAHAAEDAWARHLSNVDTHEREHILSIAPVTRAMPLRDSIRITKHRIDYYHFRINALRDHKV